VIKWDCIGCGRRLEGNPMACPGCGYTVYRPRPQLADAETQAMTGPERDEIARLKARLDSAQILIAELEELIGAPSADALNAGVDRVGAGQPYALLELLERLRGAFHKMAEDRNMWRARAKRTRVDDRQGEA